jgi:hypothetical protein
MDNERAYAVYLSDEEYRELVRWHDGEFTHNVPLGACVKILAERESTEA